MKKTWNVTTPIDGSVIARRELHGAADIERALSRAVEAQQAWRQTEIGERVSYLLTYKGEGNTTKSLYIRKNQVTEVKQMIRNYQELKTAVNRLLDLNVRLFKARQMAAKANAPSPVPLR